MENSTKNHKEENWEPKKELVDKLMKLKGEARGITIKVDMESVFREKGKEGLKKLEQELENLGCPIKYKEINVGAFYPIGLDIINILAIKKLFNFDEKKLKEMGSSSSKFSLFVRLFMRYSFSLQKVGEQSQNLWRKHYTVGNLKMTELNEEKKYLILRLDNFNFHPVYCPLLEGYFSQVCRLIVGREVFSEETKCFFRGAQCHQFLIKWN